MGSWLRVPAWGQIGAVAPGTQTERVIMLIRPNRLLHWAGRLLVGGKAGNFINLYRMLLQGDRPPRMADPPEARRILVLAPHQDDETIGCGGTLYKHARAGAEITVAYMTDGRKGHPKLWESSLPAEERKRLEQWLVQKREAEARAAAEVLGMHDLIFLGFPDSELRRNPATTGALREVLLRCRPDLIYLPFLTDRFPDHLETNRIFLEASVDNDGSLRVAGYEVWSPLYANTLVDVSDVSEVKGKALQAFESQLEHCDFIRAILGLNAYRSVVYQSGRGSVEAFFLCTLAEYRRLFHALFG